MNKQLIDRLCKQSHLTYLDVLPDGTEVSVKVEMGVKFDPEEFAELLIKECLDQVAAAIPDTACSASGAYRTARTAALARVRDHFGVNA